MDITYGVLPATNQTITVKATNACGTSAIRALNGINITLCPRLENTGSTTTGMNVYPNPAQENVNLIFHASSVYNYTINIVDVTGRFVLSLTDVSVEGTNQKHIDLNSIASGVYYMIVKSEHETQQVRFVIE